MQEAPSSFLFDRVRRRLRCLRSLGVALCWSPCIAAGGAVGYSVAQWRGNSEAARCVAANSYATDSDRVQALVGMRRDIDLSIAVLRQMADEHGEVGDQARNALHHMRERLR